MDVVCNAERKRLFTFEPAPQLNANLRQLVGWELGWISLACSTSASSGRPTYYTKHESNTCLDQLTEYIPSISRPLFSTSSMHILITFGTLSSLVSTSARGAPKIKSENAPGRESR